MRISKAMSYAITSSITLAMLADCTGISSQMGPNPASLTPSGSQTVHAQAFPNSRLDSIFALRRRPDSAHRATTPSFFDPDAKGKPLIFLDDASNSVVNIYLQAGKNHMVGQITGLTFPFSLTADASRNLYVGEYGKDILVFAPPYTGAPKLVLDDTNYVPEDISVSPNGVVAVANACSINGSGQCNPNSGNITFYHKNSNKACATVVAPATFAYVGYNAFANNGTLYITGGVSQPSFVQAVGEIKGGCKAKKITLLAQNTTIFYGPVRINKADQIAIMDLGNGNYSDPPVIYTYNHPQRGSLGKPVLSTPLQPGAQYDFKFLASGSDLYTAGASNASNEYDYPAGGVPENTLTITGILDGVAVTPPLVP